jgi:acetyltransferase
VMAADAAAQAGVALAPLPEAQRVALDAVLPAHWSRANPVDLIGDAPVARYVQAVEALLATPGTGTLLFIHAPTAIVPSIEIAQALLPVTLPHRQRVMSCWMGGATVQAARQRFQAAGIADHATPEQAVRAMAMQLNYRRNQAQLMQTPPTSLTHIDVPTVRSLIDAALAQRREWLHEHEAKALLAACGVPVVATRHTEPSDAAALAAALAIGWPVAVKTESPQITHKSDVGGVALNLQSETELRAALAAMRERAARLRPDAQISGWAVQAMVQRPRAIELIVGSTVDPLFGPVLLFGQGGTAVEVLADRAVALPPLNLPLAQALITRTRVARLLAGWRDVPPSDVNAVAQVLIALSQLLAEEPRIVEIDVNPLLADARGVIALDARVRLSAAAPGGAERFAIRPYPQALVQQVPWRDQRLTLRPIRADDEPRHREFLSQVTPDDLRLRVFHSRRSIEHSELARLTQIDYDREMAFIATLAADGEEKAGEEQTLGVARAICDPDNQDAEFGILVRSDLHGQGLGGLLMHKLITHLRERGTQRLVGTVLKENISMLKLARALGFAQTAAADDPSVWFVVRSLHKAETTA